MPHISGPAPPAPLPVETLEGNVERVVYADAESGWSVVRLLAGERGRVTAVGVLPGVRPGETLRLSGRWIHDQRYGAQFETESYLPLDPSTLVGIERFLGSGLIPGVGAVTARRLVERFGEETLEVIEREPQRLTEVEGIGGVRSRRIHEAWKAQRGIKEVMVFLQGHGISPGLALRIHRRFGPAAIGILKSDPYRLAREVDGVGFQTADEIAGRLEVPRDSPGRAAAGVLHVLESGAEAGHVFLPRERLVARAAELLAIPPQRVEAALSDLLGTGGLIEEPAAGIGAAVYLPQLHAAEADAAARVESLLAAARPAPGLDVEAAVAWVEARLDPGHGVRLAPQQREAIRSGLTTPLLVVTGGPGTGKTTLIRGIVEILGRQGQRIELAAPTGRAAKRLSEATGTEARTLHRLLEFDPQARRFKRHRDRPLEADLVVVDEASMLDCLLARSLLDAVPDQSRLILVGDVDQLPSVGPGRVLHDLIRCGRVPVVRLEAIFRQAAASLIVQNAHRINRGELPALEADPRADFFFIEREAPEELLATLRHLIAERIPQGFGLDPRSDVQVLSPMRRGALGANSLNRELQALLNPRGKELSLTAQALRVGDRVMQVRNNYDLEVFNGDIGRLVAEDEEEATVEVDFDGRRVAYGAEDLDDLVLAYASSVHKAQGSEYPAVVIPLHAQHYLMLQRNLLYTAVTRARRLVVLVGSRRALALAVGNRRSQHRFTRLAERLGRPDPAPRPG